MLTIWGSEDRLIAIRESAGALRAHLEAGTNTDRTFRAFRGASHGLAVGTRGRDAIYAPGFLKLTARWLRERLTSGARRQVVDTPLPAANGATVTRAIDPAAWHGTPAAQIAWATLVLAVSLLALGLRSGIPTTAVVALDVLALLSLPAGLAIIIAETGQGIPTFGGYPVALWPAVVLTVASAALTVRVIIVHARSSAGSRRRTALAALSAGSASLIALMTYWLF